MAVIISTSNHNHQPSAGNHYISTGQHHHQPIASNIRPGVYVLGARYAVVCGLANTWLEGERRSAGAAYSHGVSRIP
jgi:hypothetical protein